MRSKVVLFILAFLVWCFLSWAPDWQHLIIGIPVALLVAMMTGNLFAARLRVLENPRRYWYFVGHYVPRFLWECFKANIDVAYRVLHPKLPINPGIVKVKTKLKSDAALTFLANSITLTPGTMSVDIDKENGVLYIHWINVKEKDVEAASEIIAGRFEEILMEIFE